MKVSAAAHRLDRAVSTVNLMAKRGEIEVDPETDSSNALFVTRMSVEACMPLRVSEYTRAKTDRSPVPLADVVLFTGYSRTELLDLVQAGVLEQIPGRGVCELTAASLRSWMRRSA